MEFQTIGKLVTEGEGLEYGSISVELLSDEELLKVNQEFLDHDYFTDIITFDSRIGNSVHGELLISKDRVKENSEVNNVTFAEELDRIVIHGVLHLCGYKDKLPSEKELMTSKENYYLSKL